jgi:hypothetical protein
MIYGLMNHTTFRIITEKLPMGASDLAMTPAEHGDEEPIFAVDDESAIALRNGGSTSAFIKPLFTASPTGSQGIL